MGALAIFFSQKNLLVVVVKSIPIIIVVIVVIVVIIIDIIAVIIIIIILTLVLHFAIVLIEQLVVLAIQSMITKLIPGDIMIIMIIEPIIWGYTIIFVYKTITSIVFLNLSFVFELSPAGRPT